MSFTKRRMHLYFAHKDRLHKQYHLNKMVGNNRIELFETKKPVPVA